MTETSSPRSTRVLLCGSNAFEQLDSDLTGPFRGELTPHPSADIAYILATSTYQTLYLDSKRCIQSLGQWSHHLKDAYELLRGEEHAEEADELVFVGQDVITAIVDAKAGRCCFLQYDEEEQKRRILIVDACEWKTACADGRGRVMALDLEGRAYLFDSGGTFQAATGAGEAAEEARGRTRIVAQRHGNASSNETRSVELPKFETISAGNAHFVLLAPPTTGKRQQHSAVWIFGDARFGAVPIQPYDHTTVVGWLPSHKQAAEQAVPTDVPLLMPVPHFDADQGFPSRIASISAGSRHTLVLTVDGDVYGWGWNEHAALVPFASNTPSWENNIVSEPTLITLIDPTSPASDVNITKVVGANNRSLAIPADGRLAVAGSNEFMGLALLQPDLSALEKKPKFEREFSQIKSTFDCVNGFQLHPWLGVPANEATRSQAWAIQGKVVDIHASALGTLITLEDTQ